METIKKISLFILFNLIVSIPASLACDLCKENQPKPLQNITHGLGPQSDMDYVIIFVGIIIVALTLFFSLKFLLKPGEKNPNHIKNIVVNEGDLVNQSTTHA
jgi:hypothetical protein